MVMAALATKSCPVCVMRSFKSRKVCASLVRLKTWRANCMAVPTLPALAKAWTAKAAAVLAKACAALAADVRVLWAMVAPPQRNSLAESCPVTPRLRRLSADRPSGPVAHRRAHSGAHSSPCVRIRTSHMKSLWGN